MKIVFLTERNFSGEIVPFPFFLVFGENECRKSEVSYHFFVFGQYPEQGEADANWIFLIGYDYSQIKAMKNIVQRL